METDEKFVFDTQWLSESSVHEFLLYFFPSDNAVELIDTKAKKVFLKRIPVQVSVKDLVPGARIFIFGRKIHILDYANLDTKLKLASKSQRAFVLVPGQSKSCIDQLFQKLSSLNLKLNNCFLKQVSSDDLIHVKLLDDDRIADVKFNILNEPSIILELSGKSVDLKVEDINECLECPGVFGTASEDVLDYFFKNSSNNKQQLPRNDNQNSLLLIIKPHAVQEMVIGDILNALFTDGFQLLNIKLLHLDRNQCDDFLRVYEGVVPEFIQMSIHLASGPMLALELISTAEDLHSKLRNFCGPSDPEIAKKLRPHTLRARFGLNKICNAVHCTDLKDDVGLELNYFFP